MPPTQFEIESVLRRLMRGRTTLMVAHKLSAVRDADRIVVLKRGRVLEMGNHGASSRIWEGGTREITGFSMARSDPGVRPPRAPRKSRRSYLSGSEVREVEGCDHVSFGSSQALVGLGGV